MFAISRPAGVFRSAAGRGITRQCSGPTRRVSFLWLESRCGAGSATDRHSVRRTSAAITMNEAPRDTQEMAMATYHKDLEAVRRILARKPNLSDCLDGYSRS